MSQGRVLPTATFLPQRREIRGMTQSADGASGEQLPQSWAFHTRT